MAVAFQCIFIETDDSLLEHVLVQMGGATHLYGAATDAVDCLVPVQMGGASSLYGAAADADDCLYCRHLCTNLR